MSEIQQFNKPLQINPNEVVNGYKLYKTKNVMRYNKFLQFKKMWNENKQISREEFDKEYEDLACDEWTIMDRNGNFFKGFYNFPEGSYEEKNASTLTRKDNCDALWELTKYYPAEIVLKTIEFGCKKGHESVRMCNFLCEWIRRKIYQIENLH